MKHKMFDNLDIKTIKTKKELTSRFDEARKLTGLPNIKDIVERKPEISKTNKKLQKLNLKTVQRALKKQELKHQAEKLKTC